jgi:predicted thioesterase
MSSFVEQYYQLLREVLNNRTETVGIRVAVRKAKPLQVTGPFLVQAIFSLVNGNCVRRPRW